MCIFCKCKGGCTLRRKIIKVIIIAMNKMNASLCIWWLSRKSDIVLGGQENQIRPPRPCPPTSSSSVISLVLAAWQMDNEFASRDKAGNQVWSIELASFTEDTDRSKEARRKGKLATWNMPGFEVEQQDHHQHGLAKEIRDNSNALFQTDTLSEWMIKWFKNPWIS